MASNNKVCVNIDQTDPASGGFTDAEKLQARKNTGAASILSLAESFESRAPNYKWDAGEVCSYGGTLWQFDVNHTGDWTGADVHETTIFAPKDGLIYVQENGIWRNLASIISSSWVEINNKIGHLYQPSSSGRVSFLYNKNLALIMLLGWIDYGEDVNSDMATVFEFNNDLPGSQDNKLFSGTCIAITKNNNQAGGFGSVRIIPNNDSQSSIARKITYERHQNASFRYITGINYVLSINSSLLDAFNTYLA